MERRTNFNSGRVWRVAACALFAAAVALLLLRRFDAAFMVGALGAVAWLVSVRAGLIRKHDLVKVSGRNWQPRGEVEKAEAEAAAEDEED